MCPSVWRRKLEDSHPDDVLHVKILQWCDVGVVTFVILQDHLLDDAIQQQPVLHRVTTSLVWRETQNTERGARFPLVSWPGLIPDILLISQKLIEAGFTPPL